MAGTSATWRNYAASISAQHADQDVRNLAQGIVALCDEAKERNDAMNRLAESLSEVVKRLKAVEKRLG